MKEVSRSRSLRRVVVAVCFAVAASVAQAYDLDWIYEDVDRPAPTAESVSATLGVTFVTELLTDVQASEGTRLNSFPPVGFLLFLR